MLPKYVSDAEERARGECARGLLTGPTLAVMGSEAGSAGLSDDSGSDGVEDGDDSSTSSA